MIRTREKFGYEPNGLIEDALEVSLGQGRALEVLVRADLLGANERLVERDGLHALRAQALESAGVFSQIQLGANKDDWDVRRVVVDLGEPLMQMLVLWPRYCSMRQQG